MPAPSFQSCQSAGRDAFSNCPGLDTPASLMAGNAPEDLITAVLSNAHAEKVRRMKAFSGQRKFHAPVADDFARGMLAPGQSESAHNKVLRPADCAWAALITGLKTWWREKKSG